MSRPAVAIPEKLFFKIGEVCELAGVQAHVLRYWESEFPMLAPQKNRAGQRVYRKRDVEMALRIKELLYEDQYTIAGAKKRLTNELRGGGKLKVVGGEDDAAASSASEAPLFSEAEQQAVQPPPVNDVPNVVRRTAEERQALKQFASELRELLALLEQENKGRAKSCTRKGVTRLTIVLWQDTKSGRRDVAQPGSAHAWGA
jgi:DNA-binding transcriptional MerR regulator